MSKRRLTRRQAMRSMMHLGMGAGLTWWASRALAADGGGAAPADDLAAGMEAVRGRLREAFTAGRDPGAEARDLLKSLRADGTWAEIDYADVGPANWKASAHTGRLVTLARAYRVPGPLKGDPELKRGLLAALDHWLEKDYRNPNWWWNEIGVPRPVGVVLLLMEEDLTPAQMAKGLKLLERAKLGMTGQNTVWVAEITIIRGCLARDPAVVREAFGRIAGEVKITTGEGIQPDSSYRFHGAQLYSGGYGRGFAADAPHFAVLAAGTPFAFSPEKIEILGRYLLDGEQWMVRGRTFDYSAIGREITRRGGNAGAIASGARAMATLWPAHRDELLALAARAAGETPPAATDLEGNRHFWRVDYMAHRRKEYAVSIRMASSRVKRSELVNGENLKGQHLSDGVTLLYRTGEEYRDIFGVWDWKRLPGITCQQGAGNGSFGQGQTAFAGGASDGTFGVAAYDFAHGNLKARKAWFCFEREIVCLGAGITSPTDDPVLTSVNQCLLKGAVTLSEGGAAPRTVEKGQRALAGPAWVHHEGIGYLFPEKGALTLKNEAQSGTWRSISVSASPAEESLDVFSLWLEHGKQVAGGTYQYVLAPNVPLAEMPGYARALPVEVLRNTPELQAVRHKPLGVLGIAFYAPGSLDAGNGQSISVDKACLVLLAEQNGSLRLTVANPECQPLEVSIALSRKLAGEGCAWDAAQGVTRVTFALPGEGEAGKSVVRLLKG